MALSRRGFIKGLSAAMAAILPIRCVDIQSKEFDATEPFEPPDGPLKDFGDLDLDTPLTEVTFDEQTGCWDYNGYPFYGSGNCKPERQNTSLASGVIPQFEDITQEEMERYVRGRNRTPSCSG